MQHRPESIPLHHRLRKPRRTIRSGSNGPPHRGVTQGVVLEVIPRCASGLGAAARAQSGAGRVGQTALGMEALRSVKGLLTTRLARQPSSRLTKKGECRRAKPLCRESEGVPQIQLLPPSWPGRGPGGWPRESSSTLLAPPGGHLHRSGQAAQPQERKHPHHGQDAVEAEGQAPSGG